MESVQLEHGSCNHANQSIGEVARNNDTETLSSHAIYKPVKRLEGWPRSSLRRTSHRAFQEALSRQECASKGELGLGRTSSSEMRAAGAN